MNRDIVASPVLKQNLFQVLSFGVVLCAASCRAGEFEGSIDQYAATLSPGQPAVIHATLHNGTQSRIFLTGFQVLVSYGASGAIYNPDLLHESLQALGPGQTWDGPLAVLTPKHRGPLSVSGSLIVKGGTSPKATDMLVSIPLRFSINDPSRNPDGSFNRDAVLRCDRSPEHCCDPSESLCFEKKGGCVYIADGFNRQQLCIGSEAGKVYDHINDLRVSVAGNHVGYIASDRCLSSNTDELCRRKVVIDSFDHPAPGQAKDLILSSDGSHWAFVSCQACARHLGKVICSGPYQIVLDGHTSPKYEAVRSLSFSSGSTHVDYEIGRRCHPFFEGVVSTNIRCQEWTPATFSGGAKGI